MPGQSVLEAFQANISERMGTFYSQNDGYNKNIQKEEESMERLRQNRKQKTSAKLSMAARE